MTFTAFYDLQHGPVSFDFVTWLVRAKKEAGDRKLHVVIVPNEQPGSLGGFSRVWGKHDEHATRWRLWHILVASCPLAGATVMVAPSRYHAEEYPFPGWWPEGKVHFMGPLVDAARKGEQIPKLRATEAARRYVEEAHGYQYITLTLRQQDTDPARNSNRRGWDILEAAAVEQGFSVVRLEDSNVALARGKGYAELDPDLRLALYEGAAMNFCGNNGPQELLKFSSAHYRIVGLGLPDWKEHFKKYFHMEYGEQLPWAGPNQKLIYEPDTAEVLLRELENFGGR